MKDQIVDGTLTTRITVWIAVLGYACSTAMLSRRDTRFDRSARYLWSIGCVFLLLHTLSAYHFFYEWSHQIAMRETAIQTMLLTGIERGEGLYANYLFMGVWVADCAYWWCVGLDHYRKRSPRTTIAVQGFMGLIVFNGTIVFGRGAIRWFGILAMAFVIGCFLRGRQTRKEQLAGESQQDA